MSGGRPKIQPPSREQISDLAAEHHIDLTDEQLDDFRAAIAEMMSGFERLDELREPRRELTYTDREPGYRPASEEDPYNAFVTRCRVAGSDTGILEGYDVAIKDNVAVAGVEMTLGSKLFRGYVPMRDATVVTRFLDEGATITAKTNMDAMADSGSGEITATGSVLNPRSKNHLAGGSSGGSVAAVVNGDVDVAIGSDEGGSVRIPASWSGAVGHKPTYGLVPYTGAVGLGYSFDHLGPIGTTVEDCAKVLDAVAGKDPLDPRQGRVETDEYVAGLSANPSEITVGVLREGFEQPEAEEGVNEVVEDALASFGEAGATVTEVSLPYHHDAIPIFNAMAIYETAMMYHDEGVGRYGKGLYDTQLAEAFGKARRTQADDLPPTTKLTLIAGEYVSRHYRSHYYAKAKNLTRKLQDKYDSLLEEVDVLAMPTTPQTAHERKDDISRLEVRDRALNMIGNTAPFNATGHPAISVPAGTSDTLPVGLMFVGRHFEDVGVLSAGYAFEKTVGWEL